jgi:hypothetical protein
MQFQGGFKTAKSTARVQGGARRGAANLCGLDIQGRQVVSQPLAQLNRRVDLHGKEGSTQR